jgi:hypothetical protein
MGEERTPLRESLEALLKGGLQTEWRKRAYDSRDAFAVTQELKSLPAGDHAARLRVAGFTDKPYEGTATGLEESCKTCMYFAQHRSFCVLPELKLPVKPDWSCRLWRI